MSWLAIINVWLAYNLLLAELLIFRPIMRERRR